jgi:hypothetical protein
VERRPTVIQSGDCRDVRSWNTWFARSKIIGQAFLHGDYWARPGMGR